jgi:hypothetical protein
MLLSAGLLFHWLSRLTFWRDEWGILLHRRGWSVGTFLDPAVEHLTAIPILIYKLLLETVGMDSPVPFQIVGVLSFLLTVALLYVYARSRVGQWLALAAIIPILFLGPSWSDLLFPYQMGFFGSIASGIAAFLCLDRRTRRADLITTVLLVASLMFSDVGIAFVAGVTVEIALSRQLRRAYVAVVPTFLWAIWYLGWGHTAHTFISFHNVANLPSYVLDGLASSLSVLLGLSAPFGASESPALDWGRPLIVLAIGLAGWRVYRLGRPPDRLLSTLAALLTFWSLTALNASIFGAPTADRYQLVGAVLLILVAAELAKGVLVGRWAMVAALALAVAAALANFTILRNAAHGLEGIATQERGGLAALELARARVDPGLELTQENSGVDYLRFMDAGSYLSAVDAYGSPAYSPAELAAAPEIARVAADKVSGAALGIGLAPATGAPGSRCLAADLSKRPAVTTVPPAGLILRADNAGVHVGLHRYATTSFPLASTLDMGRPELLRIPPDRSSRPWTLQLAGRGRVRVCQAGAPKT